MVQQKLPDGSGIELAHLIALEGAPAAERAGLDRCNCLNGGIRLQLPQVLKADSGKHQHGDLRAPDSEKNQLKPWLKECWCIPPEPAPTIVCAMTRPTCWRSIIVNSKSMKCWCCLDETTRQATGAGRRLGNYSPAACLETGEVDWHTITEYRRNGVSNSGTCCLRFLEGWRRVEVTDPAHQERDLGQGGAAHWLTRTMPTRTCIRLAWVIRTT